ncbi:MAG: hypothetical protein RL479_1433 [Verrucomicrobiota bacterium]|jgi:hypothetical protein
MHHSFRRLLLSAAALAALQTAAAQPDVLRNDDLSSMSNWFNSSNSGMSLAAGGLAVNMGRHALTYFTEYGSFQTLGNDKTLQVTFDLSFTTVGQSPGGFRVGLFDSNGATRPTSANNASTGFQYYDGYLFSWNPNPGSSSNALRLSARTPKSSALDTLLSSTATSTYSVVGSSGGPSGQVFQTGTTYQATYTVSRGSGSGLTFEFSVTGGSLVDFSNSFAITSPRTNAFDAFAIYSVSDDLNKTPAVYGSNYNIDNFIVSYFDTPKLGANSTEPAIPEPSTYAACAGAAVLGLAFWRRRRAAAKAAVA